MERETRLELATSSLASIPKPSLMYFTSFTTPLKVLPRLVKTSLTSLTDLLNFTHFTEICEQNVSINLIQCPIIKQQFLFEELLIL
jgi:hypothetical protein